MEPTNLGTVMEAAIARFNTNRTGDKPKISVVMSPESPLVPWNDRALGDFVRAFLYEILLSSDPEAAIKISLHRRLALEDLGGLAGFQPSYWLQLRVSGRGLRVAEPMIEELIATVGYRREGWQGSDAFNLRLGVFRASDASMRSMVFCLESSRHLQRCDLLLPVVEDTPMPNLATVSTR